MARQRTNAIQVYFSDEELALLNARMEEANCKSKSDYIRRAAIQCAFYNVDTDAIAKEIQSVMAQMHRIGVNINQIAARLNSSGSIYVEDVNELKEGVTKIWRLLSAKLLSIPSIE